MNDARGGGYAEVAVPVPIRQTYHYSLSPRLAARASVGCRVLVPFGPRLQTGVLLAITDEPDLDPAKIRPVLEVLDEEALLSPGLIELARWVADFYLAPLGETLRVFLPPGLEVSSVMMVQLTPAGREALAGEAEGMTPQRRAVLQLVHQRGTTTTQFLQKSLKMKSVYSILAGLQNQQWVEVFQKRRQARVREKRAQAVELTEAGRLALETASPERASGSTGAAKLTAKQLAAVKAIAEFRPPVATAILRREAGATPSTLKALASKGLLQIREIPLQRRPFQQEPYGTPPRFELTAEQSAAMNALRAALAQPAAGGILLHGVTGSGKTELYVRAAREVLERGGEVLVLVPEIGLTPAALQVFRSSFREKVALLHSGLAEGERRDEWFRVRRGEAPVVVGTRSAVFAPLEKLKLIIIDEEHDASYKQDETPRYHAREVALRRGSLQQALVVLGSATPSVETYYQATVAGTLQRVGMEKRVLGRQLAQTEIVDMQEEFLRHGPTHTLSTRLKGAIEKRLALGQQVLLLLNRRGFAPSLLCRSCGFVVRCDQCSVAMTFHQSENCLLCHHCSRVKQIPKCCLQCGASYIFFVGEGTERLQAVVQKLFPQVRVDRMDSDTTARKGSYFKILKAFASGETQILIGTQMIAKGHHFPNVTLAGVVAADQALAMPDFRAAERTFQLLTQVAGRSGRGESPGEVVVQTRFPSHYSLKYASRQDYQGFYEQEIEFRRTLAYPPFTSVANLVLRHASLSSLERAGRAVARVLQQVRRDLGQEDRIRILGPNPAPLEKIKGQYRHQILLKSMVREELRRMLQEAMQRMSRDRLRTANLALDLDPLSML